MRLILVLFTAAVSLAEAAAMTEDFSSNPSARGWELFGEAGLIQWDAQAQNLHVTWDSSKPNSYFRHSLGTILSRKDDFSIAFDLRLDDVAAGIVPGKPSTFPLAVGLQNTALASQPEFSRGTGAHSPNLVEFDFFPDTGFGPTIWPAIWSTNSSLSYRGPVDYTILELPHGVTMRVMMAYTAGDFTLTTTITTNGVPVAAVNPVILSPAFTDFRIDAFSVTSYSDGGQDTRFGGSLLAHGVVDNITLTLPTPAVSNLHGRFTDQQWEAVFSGREDFTYVLEATEDFLTWREVTKSVNGSRGEMILREMDAGSAPLRYYRVKARPAP
ncbi:MAG: hypothetical protein EXS31_11130 [Pedosphaera sp.]|nr:hypothetical protein [Pedosphaera sp.]